MVIVALVIFLLVLLWNLLRGGSARDEATNENANVATETPTTVLNSNVSPLNTNAEPGTETSTAATTASILNQCDGVVSQFGTAQRMVLTFNAGSGVGEAQRVVDALKAAGAPAGFFLTGTWVEVNPDLAKAIAEAGFRIYNHTYDQPRPSSLTAEELTDQLARGAAAIEAATGQSSQPFFRPPYGEFNDDIVATARAAGYCVIHWTVDALDWQAGADRETVMERVLDKARAGGIVVLQLASDITPNVIGDLVTVLRDRGYDLVTLEQLFAE